MKIGQAVETGDPTDEKMDMETLSIASPNSFKLSYQGEDGGESGSEITTFTKDGASTVMRANGVDYTFNFKRVVYAVSDLDPVVEGTYQFVSGGEQLLAQEGTLSEQQNEMKARYKLGFTVSKTQDGLAFKYNAVGGKSYALTMNPGQAVETGDPTDEKMDMDTLSIVSPNSLQIVYQGENGAESGAETTTFTQDGATTIQSVNGVNYTFKFRRA